MVSKSSIKVEKLYVDRFESSYRSSGSSTIQVQSNHNHRKILPKLEGFTEMTGPLNSPLRPLSRP